MTLGSIYPGVINSGWIESIWKLNEEEEEEEEEEGGGVRGGRVTETNTWIRHWSTNNWQRCQVSRETNQTRFIPPPLPTHPLTPPTESDSEKHRQSDWQFN